MAKTEKYLEGLTIHKVPYNIANTSDFKTNVMGKAADNELFIITDTPTFSLKIGNVTYDGTSNVSATTATQSVSGLMSAADKKKLDGIATGATKITVDTSISSTSTNPVQNKVIKTELDKKAGTAVATTSTNGLMSAADKTKLNGIATGANKTIVDTTLSDSSTNPVQNKVVKAALDNKAGKTALDAKADKTALDGKLDKTGGTLTGNLTGKYLTGTWLQTTASTDLGRTPGKVAVLDDSGWVYYRTPAEIKSDIGASVPVVTTSGSGNAYTATVPGVAEIKPGVMFVMIPHADSTDIKPTLNVNNLGDYVIGRHASSPINHRKYGNSSDWLHKGIPVLIMFGSVSWVVLDDTKPSANDLAGTVPISSGGTGATTAASARTNLGIANSDIINLIYPVGSIYITLNQTPPSELFPGTYWKQIKNRFLLSASSTYSALFVGGEATHILTPNEMPVHNHNGLYYSYIDTENLVTLNTGTVSYHVPWGSSSYSDEYSPGTGKAELITGKAGGGAAHNNMPPYLAVYMWERINKNQASGNYNEDVYFIYGGK